VTNAGWYPDPAGQPQTYRYWDGRTWSDRTTSNPYDPPPGAPPAFGQEPTIVGGSPTPPPGAGGPAAPYQGGTTPPPPPPGAPAQPGGYGGGYGQPSYQPAAGGSGGGSGKWILLAVVGVLLLALIGVAGFFGIRALTDDDDGADTADDSSETVTDGATDGGTDPGTDDPGTTADGSESTSPESTDGITPDSQQCTGGNPGAPADVPADGQLHGGGLTVPNPQGYTPEANTATAFVFADSVQTSIRQIEELWVSLYAVGGLRKDNGFESPAQAAELLVQCMTGSEDFYRGFSGRTDVRNGPVTIDGQSGHEIYAEVLVDDEEIQAEGDLLHVIVVDTGDEARFGLYISMAPIGDQRLIDRQEQTAQQITVD